MFWAFVFCLGSLFLPPLLWVKQARGKYLWLLASHAAFLACFISLGQNWFGYGWTLYLIAQLASLVVVGFSIHRFPVSLRPVAGRRLVWFFVIALILCVDLMVIFQRNGWGSASEVAYFRPPLQSDNQRNVVVIEALRRHGGSPFLPSAPFTYQLFWHQLAAGLLFPFQGTTLLSAVSGATLATGVFFYFLLLGALFVSRPALVRKRWVLTTLALLVAVHSDVFQMVSTWLTSGKLGIEVDWSAQHGFFRNFSAKAVALTSPQHAFFFGLASLFLCVRSGHRYVLCLLCYLCSPILSLLFYGPYFGIEWFRSGRRWEGLLRYVGLLGLAWFAYGVVLQTSPFEIFLRATNFHRNWGLAEPVVWLLLPVAWIACMGATGILATFWASRSEWDWSKLWLVLVSALLFFITADTEVRRHCSILFCLVTPFFLIQYWPQRWPVLQRSILGTAVALGVLGHAYFLYCYLGKPSHVNPRVPWSDYFALNDFVRKEFPHDPILAAANPFELGLDMPVIMEVTPSFSMREHAIIHSRITARTQSLFSVITYAQDVVPVGKELGYRYIVWGPVEEFTWGENTRRRFLGRPIVQRGSVGLYEMTDREFPRWIEESRRDSNPTGALAMRLEAAGWDREARQVYEDAMRRNGSDARIWLGLSRLYLRYRSAEMSLGFANGALSLQPKSHEASFLKGSALSMMGRSEEAVAALRSALQQNPREEKIYLKLLAVLLKLGQRADAQTILERGLAHASTQDELQVEQALLWKSQGKVAQAEALLKDLAAKGVLSAQKLGDPTP